MENKQIEFGLADSQNTIVLSEMSITYVNELDQTLKIEIVDEGSGPFFIMETERFAFSIEEMIRVLNDIQTKANLNNKNDGTP